jgi:hypothetical protein
VSPCCRSHGEVEVAAAIGDHATTSERCATDRGGVLPGDAELAGRIQGADEAAATIGLKPSLSGVRTEDEGLFVVQHEYWQQTMQKVRVAETEAKA